MAVDTRERRMSMLNFSDGTNIWLTQEVDNQAVGEDRATMLDLYAGISLSAGHPVMRRWGGLMWLVPGGIRFGRSW